MVRKYSPGLFFLNPPPNYFSSVVLERLFVFSIPFPFYVCRHRQGLEDHAGPSVVVSTSVLIVPERWRGEGANAELRAALGGLPKHSS